jgi:hypothetical protein
VVGEHEGELRDGRLRPRRDRDLPLRIELDAVERPVALSASFSSGRPNGVA